MYHIIRQLDVLLYPPAINILLLFAALLFWRRRRLAWTLILVSFITLATFSLPVVSRYLLAGLETHPAIPAQKLSSHPAQAIVVLGGGVRPYEVEYGSAILASSSYERLRYAAFIHRQTGLPILATGGYHLSDQYGEADLMRQHLAEDFNIQARWVENHSRTTRDNASYSAQILKRAGIKHIFLVTHSHHMGRAVDLFQAQGLVVSPAPTGLLKTRPTQWQDFIPNGSALHESRYALHEYLGRLLSFL